MPAFQIQAVYSRGEISPKLHARADIDVWKISLKFCQNFIVMRQGGIKRRPGTQYINEVKDSSKKSRLVPFIFSAAQAYVLELFDFGFRVYANGGRVGTVEVVTPWAVADLFALDYDQSNDVLDVVHKSYAPSRINRIADTNWTLTTTVTKDGPYLSVNVTGTSMTPSGTGNAVPTMTSDVLPSGTASASTNNATAYLAFDGNSATVWSAAASTYSGWVAYDYGAPRIIVGYSVTVLNTSFGPESSPKAWTFEGFDGAAWVVLDSQIGQSTWSAGETRFFSFINATGYNQYRINVSSSNNVSTVSLSIATLAFVEDAGAATPITITASSIVGVNSGVGFSANDVGRTIALLGSNAVYSPFTITGFTSTTVVSAVAAGTPLQIAQTTTKWKFGGWGTTPGWPAHVCTFEGRKAFARTNAQPSTIWLTRTGGYGTVLDFSVSVPLVEDDAISFTLTDVNEVAWIAEGSNEMLIGTAGASRTLGRDSPNLPFSAKNFRQALASRTGSAAIRPVRVDNSTLFADAFGMALHEFAQGDNGFVTPDVSVLSDHLFASGVVQLAYAEKPDSIVWAPNGNGELIGFTDEKAQSMAGMHRHLLGGNGIVESVCSIPGTGRHEVWMIVRRTIGGVTKRYIERMSASFDSAYMSASNAWYLDCALQYNGAPVTTVSGLVHLAGLTVGILADGAREADAVVTAGGQVTLASGRPASSIIVGLTYQSRARTLPSALSMGDGSGLGRKKRVMSALLDVLDTGSLKVGRSVAAAEEVDFRATTDTLGAAVPLFTGTYKPRIEGSWLDGGETEMICDGPLPATVRAITLSIDPEP